jgi:hypothetical protein
VGPGRLSLARASALLMLSGVALFGVFFALGPVWLILFVALWLGSRAAPVGMLRPLVSDYAARLESLRRWSLVVVAGALGFFLLDRVPIPITQGDTYGLAASSRALVACAHAGIWTKCPGADKYGLQQHVFGLMLAWKGLDDKSIVTVLALVNLVAFIFLLVVLVRTRAISPAGRALALLAFLLGPPLVYSIQTFGDSLSLAVNCGLVVALLRRSNPWIIAVLAAYACTARETAVLSVFPIAAAVLLILGARAKRRRWWSVDRPAAFALVAGCASGLLADGLFNVWRYGHLGNPAYGTSSNITPGVWLKVKAAAALWVSPGGGNFLYWFLGSLLAVGLPVLALRSGDRRRVAAGALVLLGLAAQTALLSAWWAPFGWYAWGPRLFLSALGMAVFAAIGVLDLEFRAASSWLRRRFVAVGVPLLALAIVSAAANLGFLVDPKSTLLWFYAPHTAACPEDIASLPSAYYHCVGGLMTWRPRNSLWSVGVHHIKSLDGTLLMLAALLATFALLDPRRFPRESVEPYDRWPCVRS